MTTPETIPLKAFEDALAVAERLEVEWAKLDRHTLELRDLIKHLAAALVARHTLVAALRRRFQRLAQDAGARMPTPNDIGPASGPGSAGVRQRAADFLSTLEAAGASTKALLTSCGHSPVTLLDLEWALPFEIGDSLSTDPDGLAGYAVEAIFSQALVAASRNPSAWGMGDGTDK